MARGSRVVGRRFPFFPFIINRWRDDDFLLRIPRHAGRPLGKMSAAGDAAAAAPAAAKRRGNAVDNNNNDDATQSDSSPPLNKKAKALATARPTSPNSAPTGDSSVVQEGEYAWLRSAAVVDDDQPVAGISGGWRRLTFELRPGEGVVIAGKFDCAAILGEVTVHGFTIRAPAGFGGGGSGGANSSSSSSAAGGVDADGDESNPPAHFDVAAWEPSPVFHAGLGGARVCVTGRLVAPPPPQQQQQRGVAGGGSGTHRTASFSVSAPGATAPARAVLVYPSEWVALAEDLLRCRPEQQPHLRVLLCGAKNTGKSTLAKCAAVVACWRWCN